MAQTSILLQGGIILQHNDQEDVVILRSSDVLIEDGRIKRIGKDIRSVPGTRIIDCQDKIVSPGFIDTHHHVWQTQLKGRHSDDTLFDYHPKGNLQFFNYTPEDVFWGEIGGLLEALDGGTTCIVDHAHMSRSPDHVFAGISATKTAGIRSIFCYSAVPNIKRWDDEFELDSHQPIPEWFYPTLERIPGILKATEGKVGLGIGFDNYHLPENTIKTLFGVARDAGAKVITSHWRRNNIAANDEFSVPQTLKDCGLLGPDILLSHATGSTNKEFKMLTDARAWVSATPATESQMAHGDVIAFKEGVQAALGADCHSNNPGNMLHTMHVGLAVARSDRNAGILAQGKFPYKVEPTTQHVFNLVTLSGARAIGEGEQLGSLKEGKKADVIVFNTSSPNMACAADEDPLAAVVRHASPSDIEVVIVGGEVRKENGKLVDSSVDPNPEWKGLDAVISKAQDGKLAWPRVLEQLRRSRKEVQERIDRCSIKAARDGVIKMWGMPNADKVLV